MTRVLDHFRLEIREMRVQELDEFIAVGESVEDSVNVEDREAFLG